MALGGPLSYFLRGGPVEVDGKDIREALADLWAFWMGARSLRMLTPGNLVIELVIGTESTRIEITDPDLLEAFIRGPAGQQDLVDDLVRNMGLPPEQALELLLEADARVRVDVLQDPHDREAWQPGEALSPRGLPSGGHPVSEALPGASGRFLGELLREEDQRVARGKRRRRSKKGEHLLTQVLLYRETRGLSVKETSEITGVPPSTLRDAIAREKAPVKVPKAFVGRKYRGRLSKPQERVIRGRLKKERNAAEVARQLGIPERTVRDVRARARAAAPQVQLGRQASVGGPRAYTRADVDRVMDTAKREGITPTEAGRRFGVPGRTARGWARGRKLE